MKIFLSFFKGVLSHWILLMGGIVSVSLTFLERVGHSRVPNGIFYLTSVLCILVASFLTWRDQHASAQEAIAARDLLQVTLDDRARRKAIREQLGAFLEDGRQLRGACSNEQAPPPNAEADIWSQKSEDFLRQNLGESYVARFHNDAGLPLSMNSIVSIPHRKLWGGIHTRMARLEQFIQEQS